MKELIYYSDCRVLIDRVNVIDNHSKYMMHDKTILLNHWAGKSEHYFHV